MNERAEAYEQIAAGFATLARLEYGTAPAPSGGRGRFDVAPGAIANDAELDSSRGDPDVRKDPPRWNGPSMVGRRFSACPSDFLEVMASFKEFTAANPREGADSKYVQYDLKDAARARGWARRNKGKAMAAAEERATPRDFHSDDAPMPDPLSDGDGGGNDDDLPF
jgi:hypothetical protein